MLSEHTEKRILRARDGLIQLVRCPKCLYMVSEAVDIIWKRQPFEMSDDGEIECCRFCLTNHPESVPMVDRKRPDWLSRREWESLRPLAQQNINRLFDRASADPSKVGPLLKPKDRSKA